MPAVRALQWPAACCGVRSISRTEPNPGSSSTIFSPVKTWPTYTLWQFADENRGFGSPPASVLPGADFNRFQGSAAELAKAWPFSKQGPAVKGRLQKILPRKYQVT